MDFNFHSVVERVLPAHMMALLYARMTESGWTIRKDVLDALNYACAVPLKEVHEVMVSKVASDIDGYARQLLHDLNPDEERHGLIVCAAFCLRLVDEKHLDPMSQACLVSLAFMDELRTDPEHWGYSEKMAYQKAGAMLLRAHLLGLYLTASWATAPKPH